ncbi:MAG TPA: hypothetical protein VL283_01505 [Candidatus Baltobacteraceae bacterium]|nr:hypothetical protein [Candidatus Baltobacteraceae bacterium]
MGDNFFIKPSDDSKSKTSKEGVVSGELGEVTPEERLDAIEAEARQDGQLSEIFAAAEGDPAARAGMIVDRINAMQRELALSDSDASFKKQRGNWLSSIANRLRELL